MKKLILWLQARRNLLPVVFLWIAIGAFLLYLIAGFLPPPTRIISDPPPSGTPTSSATSDECPLAPKTGASFDVFISPARQKETIGVSDGSFIFDGDRPNKEPKCQGAIAFAKGDMNTAGQNWTQAVILPDPIKTQQQGSFQQQDSNDAEALIYRENSRVIHSFQSSSPIPYITFIIGTVLTGDDVGIGRDILQGTYVAQEEFNRTHEDPNDPYHLHLRLLIANFGSDIVENPNGREQIDDAVTNKIVAIAQKKELNVKGVVLGLPFTLNNTINTLNSHGIPVILSGTYSETQLPKDTNSSIFSVTASTESEGRIGANFILQQKPQNIALFVNQDSPYSVALADSFQNTIRNKIVLKRYSYIGRDHMNIPEKIDDALQDSSDFIYFAGDSKDLDIALGELEQKQSTAHIMGADALYELAGYSGEHYKFLYFTSFAYPDKLEHLDAQPSPFSTLYRLLYTGWPLNRVYGYLRPDNDAILSYRALSAFSDASISIQDSQFSFDDLTQALTKLKNGQSLSGPGGSKVSFDFNYADRTVLILYVDNGLTQCILNCN